MSILNHRPSCTNTARRKPRPNYLPPIVCTPWCWLGDGHPREQHPEDQQCMAGDVDLFAAGGIVTGYAFRCADGSAGATLSVESRALTGYPLSVNLTVSELTALIGNLQQVLETAQGADGDR